MAKKRHFLFLQGNATPFYRRLGKCLAEAGHQVSRINVGGGDYLFWGDWNAINWRQTPEELAAEMPDLMRQLSPSDIILFGDCRPIHRTAIESAKTSGIRVYVFEEGYFRPHWITLERDGVNGYSRISRDPEWYLEAAQSLPAQAGFQPVGGGLRNRILLDFAWQAANYVFLPKFPGFHTHRPYPIWREYASWLTRLARLPARRQQALDLQEMLIRRKARFFLFPLQLDSDTQIRVHSPWKSMVPIIEHVVASFAENAPSETQLVIKNHPLDNGMIDYHNLVWRVATSHGVASRIHFIDGGNLDRLAAAATGVVTVNSTAAMTAIEAACPTIALGSAIFALPGITFQGELRDFWSIDRTAMAPAAKVVDAFTRVVRYHTQLNGNFYTERGIRLALGGAMHKLLDASLSTRS